MNITEKISAPEAPVLNKKLMITVPLAKNGGVREVYKLLDLDNLGVGSYFSVHSDVNRESSVISLVMRLIRKYLEFYREVANYDMVLLNPSLLPKSYLRDAGFAIITRLRGKKLVVFWHGWLDEYEEKIKGSFWLKQYYALSFARAQGIIILGSVFKRKLSSLGPPPKVPTLQFYNIVDDHYLADFDIRKRFEPKEKFTLLFLSRIYKHKGVYIAIDTFRALCAAFPQRQFELVIAGDGKELENAKTYVRENAIEGVVFPGFVSGREKHETLKNGDLFIFPTYFPEGLPLAVLEAMLYGMPVVTRPVAGLPDIVENGVNGYLVESLDIADFLEPVKKLVMDEDHYRQVCANNHEFAMDNVVKHRARQILADFLNAI